MEVIELTRQMQDKCQLFRQQGKQIRLVPTMGALHAGHASMISLAGKTSFELDKVLIVSIFVNQMQFNNAQDFANYPKSISQDLELCRSLGVDVVFAPKNDQMYPNNECLNTICAVEAPKQIANDLEGKSRPGHFKGMLTVVCKLFNIIKPHEAFFGEKDYQQLVLVDMMSRNLNFGVKIIPVATIRDFDSLPLSSRNVRLDVEERKLAPFVYHLLDDARLALESEQDTMNPRDLRTLISASQMTSICLRLDDEGAKLIHIDYLELRCAGDLSEVDYDRSNNRYDCQFGCARKNHDSRLVTRLLTSIIVGKVRLLDNMEIILNSVYSKQS